MNYNIPTLIKNSFILTLNPCRQRILIEKQETSILRSDESTVSCLYDNI